MKGSKYPIILLVLFIAAFLITTIHIPHPHDFVLEHIATVALIIILLFTYNKFRLSNLSYTLIFTFMILHIIGAHYTYAEVPYDSWFKAVFGTTLNELVGFTRNNYDRIVHFSFGLLMAYPIREMFLRIVSVQGFWGYYLPLDVVMAFSMIYELLEWLVAVVFGGDLGMTYLGTQGDVWDAHKDMLFASLGALITMIVIASVNYFYKRDGFHKEMKHSFKVKRKTPLGEVELKRMRKK